MRLLSAIAAVGLMGFGQIGQETPAARQESPTGIKHGVLCFGAETFLLSGEGKVLWSFPKSTRDGWMLQNGNVLMAVNRDKDYPGGAALEVDREGKTVFEYKGTQAEVNTVQPLPNNHVLLTEAGPKPRVIEVDRAGKIVAEMPIQCQLKDAHMQSRMSRKVRSGNYLIPQMLELAVKEYDKEGKIVWEVKTPGWPFSVIRLQNGNTVISCTRSHQVMEVDKEGKTVWLLSNEDLPGAPIKDACGAQILANGNLVLTAYGAGGETEAKVMEINREKKIVWTLFTGRKHGVHAFQIVNPDGTPIKGRTQK